MKQWPWGHFNGWLAQKKEHFPLSGQVELTYRCNLNCVHCYCKGSEDKDKELTTKEWKKIFDQIQKEGCIYLTITGGEPLIRKDFLELYAYAKEKGFIVTIFTNGQAFNGIIINRLADSPPYSIEITLNGITKNTYESIADVKGSFEKAIANIKKLKKKGLPLILKLNCLKQNKHEIGKIKKWTEDLLGKPGKNKYYFKYDPMIFPRLNGDKASCDSRISFEEMTELRKQDKDIWKEYQRGLHGNMPGLGRNKDFLYRCNTWMSRFFINPYGRLKFCEFSDKFSVDLKTIPFKHGFYGVFPGVLNEKFKTNSKCINCKLRAMCYHCPARACLETGNEEVPVEYYCQLAKKTFRSFNENTN